MEFSNEKLLEGARNLKAKGYTPQQVDSWLQSKGSSLKSINDFASQPEPTHLEKLTKEQKAKIKARVDAYNNNSHLDGVLLEGFKGLGQGLISGAGRYASGATLGATDWLDRKTGGHLKALEDELSQYANAEGLGWANELGKFAAESGGMVKGVGKYIMPNANTIPSMIEKGTIEGSIYGATASDNMKELPQNVFGGAIMGGGTAGMLGGIDRIAKRLVPALNAEGKAKSLADAFSDRDSTIALKRGARASQEISDDIAKEMPTIKDSINSKMNEVVNKTIGETPDINGMVNQAKTGYSDYMIYNADRPVNLDPIRSKYKSYTKLEKSALKDALKSANFETNAQVGSVEHAHQMRMALDDMIDSASKKSNNRQVPKLMKVREDLDKVLKTDDGYRAIDEKYAQAMRVQDAYNAGRSASKKTKAPSFENETERKAWLSGVNDTLQNNLANGESNYAKSVANNLSIFKNGLNKEELNAVKKASNAIGKEYKRADSLDRIVNKESYAENLPFWREILESVGSAVGSTVSTGEKALFGLSDRATARRILNGKTDSNIAKAINKQIDTYVPHISALSAKKMAEY